MHPAIIIGTVRSLIVDVAMGQIPRSTERISSLKGIVSVCFRCPARTVGFSGTRLYLCILQPTKLSDAQVLPTSSLKLEHRYGAHLPLIGTEHIGGYITKSVTCGGAWCVARPMVTFPASELH